MTDLCSISCFITNILHIHYGICRKCREVKKNGKFISIILPIQRQSLLHCDVSLHIWFCLWKWQLIFSNSQEQGGTHQVAYQVAGYLREKTVHITGTAYRQSGGRHFLPPRCRQKAHEKAASNQAWGSAKVQQLSERNKEGEGLQEISIKYSCDWRRQRMSEEGSWQGRESERVAISVLTEAGFLCPSLWGRLVGNKQNKKSYQDF